MTDSNVLFLTEHALMQSKIREVARQENKNNAATAAAPFSLSDSNILYIADHHILARKIQELAQQENRAPQFLDRLAQDMKIKEYVDSVVRTVTPILVDNHLLRALPKYLQERLPAAIVQQLPAVLSQDLQMAHILNTHAAELQATLTHLGNECALRLQTNIEGTGRIALAGLVADPTYHELTTAHLANMREKHAEASAAVLAQHQYQVAQLLSSGKDCIRECRETVNQVATLRDRVARLETVLSGLLIFSCLIKYYQFDCLTSRKVFQLLVH